MGSRRRRGQLPSLLSTWAALTSVVSAINFTEISLPNILTDGYGRMGLVGDFDSISLYQYAEQGTQTFFANGSHAIMTQLPNGDLTTVAVTNGHINDMCLFTLKDGTLAGLVVGGNFTRIGDVSARGIALVNPETGAPIPLDDGFSGTVNTLLCDTNSNNVFVGGDFSYRNSTNALRWQGMDGWQELPFQGFNGPVESISRMDNGTIVFGGRFTAVGNETLNSNLNGTEKITQQVVNLDSSSTVITATLGSGRQGFNDPSNVICSNGTEEQAGSVFLFEDGAQGSWSADLAYTVYPTKLRLYNTHFENRGLKTFRFVSRPNNGIMNLTSVDPVSNERFYCDAWCPLSHDTNATVPYQDFNFVNVIPTYAFRIEVIEWFGDGAGLNAIELFQDDIYAFADNTLNEPSCKDIQGPSASTIEGSWGSNGGPPLTDSKFLTGTFMSADMEKASVTFRPDIRISGRYQVLVYTPGCRQDNSCFQRGEVTVTGTFASNETSKPEMSFYQTNDFDKYDVFFTGYVEANSEDHTVEITLRPTRGSLPDIINVVASKVRFILEAPADKSQLQARAVSASTRSSGRVTLNGIFSYAPGATIESSEQATAISISGTQLPINATINSVVADDKTVFIAGDIRTEQFGNFLLIDDEGLQPVALGGLNNIITDAYLSNKLIYLAGRFNDTVDASTAGLSHVAAYKVDTKTWQALGTGLNGVPTKIVPFSVNNTGIVETYFVFSGPFTKILASDTQPEISVGGIAIWVSSKQEWLERLPEAEFNLDGFLSQIAEFSPNPPFFAGSLVYNRNGLAGAVSLVKPNNGPIQLVPLGIDISVPAPSRNSNRKRAVDSSLGIEISGVQAGAFYDKKNVTILGGRFSSGDIDNLAFVLGQDNNKVEGVPGNVLAGNNVVTSLLLTSGTSLGGRLYIGGSINTTIAGAPVGGMVIFDMETNDFANPQPIPLQAPGNESVVYTITQQPNGRQIYVGGSFTGVAPTFGCKGMCVYDPVSFQYFEPGFGFGGVVYASAWTDTNTLVVGGALELNNSVVHLATYKLSTTEWTVFESAEEIPGPVTTIFTPTGEENNIYVGGNANGRPFILRWDGTKWINLGAGLQPGSILHGIEVFELDGVHAPNDLLSQSQILMASGNILLDRTPINSSAALFDGINWTPFVLTTNEDGSSGSLGAFVSQSKHTFNENAGKLAVGLVVLISLALALALIFLIVVVGVVASYIRRRREGYVPAPTRVTPVPIPQDMTERVPPDQLFQGVGFASARGTPHI